MLAGHTLGIKEVDNGIWLVCFMHYDLGYIDLEQRTLQTIDNPFGTDCHPSLRYNLSPMSPARTTDWLAGMGGFEPPHGGIQVHLSIVPTDKRIVFSYQSAVP